MGTIIRRSSRFSSSLLLPSTTGSFLLFSAGLLIFSVTQANDYSLYEQGPLLKGFRFSGYSLSPTRLSCLNVVTGVALPKFLSFCLFENCPVLHDRTIFPGYILKLARPALYILAFATKRLILTGNSLWLAHLSAVSLILSLT